MAHSLILGMTESGKSTLAKQIAQMYAKRGTRIMVYCPMNDPSWICDYQTHDFEEFLSEYWSSRQCAVFIDEAGETAQDYAKEMIKTSTKGRHWGHVNYYLSQRGAMMPRTLRDQCPKLFMFAQSLEDAKLYAREYNAPELHNVSKFRKGEYYFTTRYTNAVKGKLF